nr:hypothetical protein [Tanacetum cinerariifolium]
VDNHNQNENRFHMYHPSKSRMWDVKDGKSREDDAKRDDDEEEIAKIDEPEDTESGGGDDEETESDEESAKEEIMEEEEESFDPIPRTPEDSEDYGNDEEDQGLRVSEEQRLIEEEETDELYRDVDINQGWGLQVSQDIEDSHVTLTPVQPDVAPLPTPIPTMTPSIITTITTASHLPIPPTPIPSEVLQTLLTFDSVFRFNERLKSLEASFFEYRQTNPFTEVVSNIPGIVHQYMNQQMHEARSDEQQNLYKALIDAYEADKTILESYRETAILKRRRKDDDDQEGPSAADYGHIKWIEDLVPRTMWIQEPINYDKHALWGVSHWGRKRQQFYEFAVNRESALDVYSKKRIIAVTDLKIKRLNLTKPDIYRSDLKRREAYIAYSNPRGFIYQNKDKKNRLMRTDELHKFSDGTLNDVRNALDDRLKGIRMHYLPQTIWRKGDKDRAAVIIQAIDKLLKTRRIMRSLERFV